MEHNSISASVEYVNFIMNHAPQFGIDANEVYGEAGFDPAVLGTNGARIPFHQFVRLWKILEDKNADPDLGLHLGEKAFAFPGHILFILMLNAPTIKDAIEKFCRYFNLLNDITTPLFSFNSNLATLSIHFHTNDFKPSRQIFEGILAAYTSVLHRVSEKTIKFDGVYFVHPRPRDISEHQRVFDAPLFFDQAENKLTFNTKHLDLPLQLSNKEVLETLEQLAQKLQQRLYAYGPWSDKVSRIMMNRLKGEKTDIESIARKLAVSPRNLQKQLKNEGVTYQKLLDHVRKEQAVYFLEKTNIAISEIAFLLGYSEQSVFSRAFKRWVGSSPGQFRTRIKSNR